MNDASLQKLIEEIWETRGQLSPRTKSNARAAVKAALDALDEGRLRVAEKLGGEWRVNQWLKKAVLLSFRLNDNGLMPGAGAPAWDKVPSKFKGWTAARFKKAGFRVVPGAIIRRASFIGKGAVLMPCFVNTGAYVDENTMVDTWATIGSCAQVGRNCHISGGTGIGGVLEPLQAAPTIVEDHCFIGARSEVAEGVIVGEGSVLGMGVYIGASTKIVERATGNVSYGRVPPYSVVVPGALASASGPALYCAVIVKRVDEKTRSKTSINELLRD